MAVEVDGDVGVQRLHRVRHVRVDFLHLDGRAGPLDDVCAEQVERHVLLVGFRHEGGRGEDLLLDDGHVGARGVGAAVHAVVHERGLHEQAAHELFEGAGGAKFAEPGSVDEEAVVEGVVAEFRECSGG